MGTNYYWKDKLQDTNEDDINVHIGKMSAAGLYCWDCGTTLCRNGTGYVHFTKDLLGFDVEWFEECPCCGKKPNDSFNAANKMLGFNTGKPEGVSSCCSFTWTLLKHKEEIILGEGNRIIVDEYGAEYTYFEFMQELGLCPIQTQLPIEFC